MREKPFEVGDKVTFSLKHVGTITQVSDDSILPCRVNYYEQSGIRSNELWLPVSVCLAESELEPVPSKGGE